MTKMLSLNLALGCLISLTCTTFAEDTSNTDDAQKIVKVCTLNSVEANLEFQRNVQLLRTQRQQLVELKARLDEAGENDEKTELQSNIDELLKKLDENNEIMFKTYGFSLNRNYTMVIEKSHIYMMVTEDEAKKFEEEQKKSELTRNPANDE